MEWNAENINRLGLILGLISFLLVTPEILGESKLLILEDWFKKIASYLTLFALLAYILYTLYEVWILPDPTLADGDGNLLSLSMKYALDYTPAAIFASGTIVIFMLLSLPYHWDKASKSILFVSLAPMAILVLCYFTYLLGVLLTSQIPRLDLVVLLLNKAKIPLIITFVTIGLLIFVERMLKKLAADSVARRRFLWIGAILFVISFILQFIATLH